MSACAAKNRAPAATARRNGFISVNRSLSSLGVGLRLEHSQQLLSRRGRLLDTLSLDQDAP
jgi:hypothetical protein